MIIDAIIDRKEGLKYDEYVMRYLYDEATLFGDECLARALDGGTNADIVRELCRYIDENDYNTKIKDYIKSQNWVAVAA